MKHKLIYVSTICLAIWGMSCTDEIGMEHEGSLTGTPLSIRASQSFGDNSPYEAFSEKKQIRVYYAYNNLDVTYDFLQGIYEFPVSGDIDTEWTAVPWGPDESNKIKSIFIEDIKKANNDNLFSFTATSHPVANIGEKYDDYYVPENQNTITEPDFGKYDLRAARASYSAKEDWSGEDKGVRLHFHHLLSQFRVILVLPEGETQKGYFTNPKDLEINTLLENKYCQYSVTYSKTTETAAIFKTQTKGEDKDRKNIYMRKMGEEYKKFNGLDAGWYTFALLLPEQGLGDGGQLKFTIKVDGKDKHYTYDLPTNLVSLKQETITTIQLTVYSGQGQQPVVLNNVKVEGWKNDHADVGDLIPQPKK